MVSVSLLKLGFFKEPGSQSGWNYEQEAEGCKMRLARWSGPNHEGFLSQCCRLNCVPLKKDMFKS